MHILKYDADAGTIEEVSSMPSDHDPGCHYILCESGRLEIPRFTPEGWCQIVWQHPDWTPPPLVIKLKRRSWIMRVLQFPYSVWRQMRVVSGLPFFAAVRLSLPLLKP